MIARVSSFTGISDRWIVFAIAPVGLVLISLLDYLSGARFSSLIFSLLLIVLIGWRFDLRAFQHRWSNVGSTAGNAR